MHCKWRKKTTVDDVNNAINVSFWMLGHSSAKQEQRESYAMCTVWMRLFCYCTYWIWQVTWSANRCTLPLCTPYTSGTFLDHQRLLLSTLCCHDITVCITHDWPSSKILRHVAYGHSSCKLNITFARPSSCAFKHKQRGGCIAQQTSTGLDSLGLGLL